ncbi:Gfo/Idh/MocA family protein [Pseudactinotalea sp. Z1748]|uniref:Gfo/Idh/MocA family protein n=1 Tax=Pseudactinotalea sp. Z1748 TaxID=3413027 RepID=UPI003C7B2BB6
MRPPVRIALVGLGVMGSRWLRAVVDHPSAEIALVCDTDTERARSRAADLGTRWSADLDDLTGIDGVLVCTPEHLHTEPAVQALQAGIPVAVEKPLAHDLASAARIVEASERAGVPVLAGHILRFEARYSRIKSAIEEGVIGPVIGVRSARIGIRGDQDVLRGRTTAPLYYGTHELDLARWYAGDIERISAFRSSGVLTHQGYDIADLYSVALQFTSGAHGTSMLGWSLPDRSVPPGLSGFTVIGDDGYLQVEQGVTGLVGVTAEGPTALDTWYSPQIHGRTGGAMAGEVDHFISVIADGTDPVCTARDGMEALRASLAVEHSARTGQIIMMKEFGDR